MRSAVVVDASALVALLSEPDSDGAWVMDELRDADLAAPDLVMAETANVLRRLATSSLISDAEASLAHADLLDLRIRIWPYAALAERVWELRGSVTCYDASYLALAEILDAPLITLDRRLARSKVAQCDVRVPS